MIKSVLISGAGIAGPTLAYWLTRAGIRTTIVETAPSLPANGQQIDIRGPSRDVVKRMGLLEIIKSKTTKEQGLSFVDKTGKTRASFGVDESSGEGRSFSSDMEILRGDLAQVFYDATVADTEYIFNDRITGLDQSDDGVDVTFAHADKRRFDIVVGADGMRSATRRLMLEKDDCMHSLGMFTSYFTIPSNESDGDWAKWFNAPGRRCIILRPDGARSAARAYLSIMSEAPAGYHDLGVAGQKSMMRELFADAGWQASRVLDGMDGAEDFYMQEIAQVKMQKWSRGRVVCLGDAAYCPSPISGVGTSLAVTGAYVLAGEIARSQGDYEAAFEGYEKEMRPRVDQAQKLPPGAPGLANPQTSWGISIFLGVLSLASKLNLQALFTGWSSTSAEELVTYEFNEKGTSSETS